MGTVPHKDDLELTQPLDLPVLVFQQGWYLPTVSDFLRGIEANRTALEWEVGGIFSLQMSHFSGKNIITFLGHKWLECCWSSASLLCRMVVFPFGSFFY